MEYLSEFFSMLADTVFDQAAWWIGLAFALGVAGYAEIPEDVLAAIRRWHGKKDDQFFNINNVADTLNSHELAWNVPAGLLTELTGNCKRLDVLVKLCHTPEGSAATRAERNSLLKTTVGFCLTTVRYWAEGLYSAGKMTADEFHLLGFLLRGEVGGYHGRAEATDAKAEVKVRIIGDEYIRVVIDQSADENAGPVKHGWPHGVKNAVIVITSADGKTEVLRKITTHLYNDVRMPAGSRGKLFIIKAAFLRHVDDEPRFGGNEPTFSIPLTTEDLAAALDHQSHEDFEEHIRAVELHRQEAERLQEGVKS
jgi:hypothetical protein